MDTTSAENSADRNLTTRLIRNVNRKWWWHVPPIDPKVYKKRGKFYSSTFDEPSFYGKPGEPERIVISRPLIGDNNSLETALFGEVVSAELSQTFGLAFFKRRFALDTRMKKEAVRQGFDCIVLMSSCGWQKYIDFGKIPRSIELNVF